MTAVGWNRERLAEATAALAREGVFLGTSSWKYPGWCGSVYDESRYVFRGKFSTARFERDCLTEYAEVFPTVCVDAAYYTYPEAGRLRDLAAQVPATFRFSFKVTDEITVKRFPRLPRFGARAGTENPHFLDAARFAAAFLEPMAAIRARLGLLIFEFSRFYPADFSRGRDFLDRLERFLTLLPSGWPYGLELRNPTWLTPEYFALLARHRVTHVFNAWDAMPPVAEQMELIGSRTTPGRTAARLLLRSGRNYTEAVERFAPYRDVQEEVPDVRQAAAALVAETRRSRDGRTSFIYVNNRLEGHAPGTIAGLVALAYAKAEADARQQASGKA